MCDLHREEEHGEPRCGINELVDELTVALSNARIYGSGHPRAELSIATLRHNVAALAKSDGPSPIVLGSAEGFLFYRQKPLVGVSLSSAKILTALELCHSGGLSIDPRAQDHELRELVGLLAKNRQGYASLREANADLIQRGVKLIEFLPRFRSADAALTAADCSLQALPEAEHEAQQPVRLKLPLELYQQTVVLLQEAAARVCHGDNIDIDRTKGYVEAILSNLSKDPASMMGLSRYERYDAYTFGHSIRVCFLALHFAATLFEHEEVLLRIGLAALLHDIGKARVPFEVLHSTSRLSHEERALMNLHSNHGGEILLAVPDVDPMAVAIALGHHQTIDGAGYPRTIHAVRQSAGTCIVKICDVYEALTAVRPYKPRMSPAKAYQVMLSMKGHFDPTLLRLFMKFTGIYPVGTMVRLSRGEQARVLSQTGDPLAPVVRIEVDDLGAELEQDSELVHDLSSEASAAQWSIVGAVDSAA